LLPVRNETRLKIQVLRHSSLFANIAAQRLQGCHVLSIVPVPEKGGAIAATRQQKNIAAKFALSRMRSLLRFNPQLLTQKRLKVALEKLTRMDIMGSFFCSPQSFLPKGKCAFDKSIFCLRNPGTVQNFHWSCSFDSYCHSTKPEQQTVELTNFSQSRFQGSDAVKGYCQLRNSL